MPASAVVRLRAAGTFFVEIYSLLGYGFGGGWTLCLKDGPLIPEFYLYLRVLPSADPIKLVFAPAPACSGYVLYVPTWRILR